MAKKLGIGVVGCGNISAAYMQLAPLFGAIEMRACADLDMAAAEARARQFSLRALPVGDLLKADDIDIVVNLTIPAAHYEVSRRIVEAGKHVYSEKPFVLSVAEGKALAAAAARKKIRIGSAPDTYLGGAHQLARRLVDAGAVGKITSGTAFVLGHGMEHWHPNPGFFYKKGGGPMLDLGPYYIANLVQLIGPVKRVAALAAIPAKERKITSKPRAGEKVTVETPTTIHALLDFASGAQVMLATSWDVWQNGHSPMELYGEAGTLHVPDPNFFGGDVRMTRGRNFVNRLPKWPHPFSIANQPQASGAIANYRAAGLADMAAAILAGRPHRCSLELALHAVDVMTGILQSGESGKFVAMTTTCERPAPLDPAAARALLARIRRTVRKK